MHKLKTYSLSVAILLMVFGCNPKASYQSISLTSRQVNNLHAFARLYGYARFFYPGSETNEINWNNFVIYGSGKVINAQNDNELKAILQQLFKPIIPTLQLTDNGTIPLLDTTKLIPPDTTGYQLSYWQHHGLTNGNHSVAFRYQRGQLLNQYNKILHRNDIEEYGVICNIPVQNFKGKMLKFTADLKCMSGKGQSLLFLQPNNTDGVYEVATRTEPEKGNDQWHKREVFLSIPAAADSVLLGIFLRTEGVLSVDNCRVQVENGKEWMDIPVPNSNFERDSIGKTASGWRNWPDDYKGTLVAASTTFEQGKQVLQINANSTKEKSRFASKPLFALHPDFGEGVQGLLNNRIGFCFPLAVYASNGNTYPATDKQALSALATAVAAVKPDVNEPATRMADVMILWNVLQHGYVSMQDAGIDWEKALDTYLYTAAKAKVFKEHNDGIKKILADTKDGFMQTYALSDKTPSYYLPVTIGWVDGHLTITKAEKKEAEGLEVGDEIVKINNEDALTYFSSRDSLNSYANKTQLLYKRLLLLQYGDFGEGIKLVVQKKDGKLYSTVLPYSKPYSGNRLPEAVVTAPLKQVAPGVLYVPIANLKDQQLDSLVLHLSPDIKTVIWDCRQPFGSQRFMHYVTPANDSLRWLYQLDIVYPDKDKRNKAVTSMYAYTMPDNVPVPHLPAQSVFLSERSNKVSI